MKKIRKCCIHCHKTFMTKRNPEQNYCSERVCQNKRKHLWRKEKQTKDSNYRQRQQQANKAWQKNHRDYWRHYRAFHTDYTEHNRAQQKVRDKQRAQKVFVRNASLLANLAKRDALLDPKSPSGAVLSGLYRLVPVRHSTLAKSDALTVQISLMT